VGTVCAVAADDVLLMRPLLLHASGRSTSQRHHRVLHIEYAAFALPDDFVGMKGPDDPSRGVMRDLTEPSLDQGQRGIVSIPGSAGGWTAPDRASVVE
jgi:hypothetical protein